MESVVRFQRLITNGNPLKTEKLTQNGTRIPLVSILAGELETHFFVDEPGIALALRSYHDAMVVIVPLSWAYTAYEQAKLAMVLPTNTERVFVETLQQMAEAGTR